MEIMYIEEIEKKLIEQNLNFQWKLDQGLETFRLTDKVTKYSVLIFTCMDPRIDVHRIFQLEPGDVFVLRNAGNVLTKDMLRSIFLAVSEFSIKNIIVLGHLDCGMTKIKLHELKTKLGMNLTFPELRDFFQPFVDELMNISNQVRTLRENRIVSSKIEIIGMLYDVNTGYVFESEIIDKFSLKEDFYKEYLRMIEKKHTHQLNTFKKWKEKTNSKKEDEQPIIEQGDKEIIQELNEICINEDLNNDVPNTQTKNDRSDLFKIYIPKFNIPKIHIPKINIHVPQVYKKKIEK